MEVISIIGAFYDHTVSYPSVVNTNVTPHTRIQQVRSQDIPCFVMTSSSVMPPAPSMTCVHEFGENNICGILVYSKAYTFPILLENVLSVFLYKSYTRFKTLPLDKHLTFG
jgi:hypothetical protein